MDTESDYNQSLAQSPGYEEIFLYMRTCQVQGRKSLSKMYIRSANLDPI